MSVIWHEAECAGYAADLKLWEDLAERAGGRVLELGCGTGRVAVHLARHGHAVTGLDMDRELIATFANRARSLPATAALGDARHFSLGLEFDLVLAPMQLVQLFEGSEERLRCMRCIASHLDAAGMAAIAIVEELPRAVDVPSPLPDTREVDGWVYSSLPVATAVDSEIIRIRRLRQTVSPSGELSEELNEVSLRTLDAATLEDEAREAGLGPAGRLTVPPTDEHVGSTVVLLEKGR
jgi:SAM-dependent methyltransferase